MSIDMVDSDSLDIYKSGGVGTVLDLVESTVCWSGGRFLND